MLKINMESIIAPYCTCVNGWFNEKPFEFTHRRDKENDFQFKTKAFIKGSYIECEPLSESERKDLMAEWRAAIAGVVFPVPYVSVWDDGMEITTTADVNIRTGEVTNITVADVSGLSICERKYIIMNDEQVDVYEDEQGYVYWADIKGVYGSVSDDAEITTQCINGVLKSGDLVLSAPSDEHVCLIGRVGAIYLVGTPEHDETENEADDVHVDFLVFEYSDKRMAEIADMFSSLYGEPKEFEDCSIDDVIMSPDCLIRITGISDDTLKRLLDSGFEAACYCYNTLAGLMMHAGQPDNNTKAESGAALPRALPDGDDVQKRIFDVIDSAVTLAGFKVLDGDKDSVIIRHCESDADFEIKISEIPC